MARCEVCGNDYGMTFEVHAQGAVHVFDCFSCAIHRMAPICEHCRVPHAPSPADLSALGVEAPPGATLWRGKGCAECRSTGYRGRSGIYELFTLTEEVRSLILRRASARDIRRLAIEGGMVTLRVDGWLRACEGVTTIEEVLRVTQEDA